MEKKRSMAKRISEKFSDYYYEMDNDIREIIVNIPKSVGHRIKTAEMLVEGGRDWRDCDDGRHQFRFDRRPSQMSDQLHLRPKNDKNREIAYIDNGTGRRSEPNRLNQSPTRAMKDIARTLLNLPSGMKIEGSVKSEDGLTLLLEVVNSSD